MNSARPALLQTGAIVGWALLAFGVLINAASLVFGIVLWPLLVVTFTYPLATLLALVVGVRLGAWSRLPELWRFGLGIGVSCAGLVAYVEALHFSIGFSNGDTPPILQVAFFCAALLLVAGYGIVIGAVGRFGVLLVRRAL